MTRVVLLGVQVFTMAVSVAVGFAVVRLRNTKVIHRYVIISRVIHSCAILLFPLLTTIFASTKAGVMRNMQFVCHPLCHTMCRITAKVIS